MKRLKALGSAAIVSTMIFAGANIHAMQPKSDIVDTAIAAGDFNTLVTAVQAAGLVDTLKGEGPFTVFAPTDEAFAKIPADQLKALLADKEKLVAVLTYHVVPGKVMSEEVVKMDMAKTVQGQSVGFKIKDEMVFVDGAQISAVDIETSNGVIHIIDTVILPK
ncbi:fasciclin domain-containing protein [Pseudomonadota bacterium]